MRLLIISVALLASSAAPTQTLLGNCSAGILGIQLSTGNIYCSSPPASAMCGGTADYSQGCALLGGL
jgi:hypothetical protein